MKLSDLNNLALPVAILCRTEDNPIMWQKDGDHWRTEDVKRISAEDMVATDWKILGVGPNGEMDWQDNPHPKITKVL